MIRGPSAYTLKTQQTPKKQKKRCSKHNSTSSHILLNYCYHISIALQGCLGANVFMTTCVKYSKMTCWS